MLSEGGKRAGDERRGREVGENDKRRRENKKKMVISGISRCLFCLLIPEQKFRFGISNPLKSAGTCGDVAALDDLWWVDAPLFRP